MIRDTGNRTGRFYRRKDRRQDRRKGKGEERGGASVQPGGEENQIFVSFPRP